MTGPDAREATLGERLDAAAGVIVARHQVRSAWASLAVPVLRRAARQIESPGGQFKRYEAPAGGPALLSPAPVPSHGGNGSGPAFEATVAWPDAPAGSVAEANGARFSPAGAAPGADATGQAADPMSPAAALPPDTRARLANVAGPGAGLLQVRADAAADSIGRVHRADAVTIGTDVHFRGGRFRPDDPDGFALLAHEAAHVTALLDPSLAQRRATAGGVGAEEDAALAVEARARRRFGPAVPGPTPAGRPAAVPGAQPAPGLHPAAPEHAGLASGPLQGQPMRAPVDRDIGQPPFDIDGLRRDLIADLTRQLRAEFERGG